ncbi:Sister chromatid cohesion protein DCC1 [Gryllus bimaculatus]|nr:Sister chromatid cohesion protein DCC1 [Gryllus bimaculatus]
MAGRYIRTIEESQVVINHAKIDESDLKSITQPLYFSEHADEFEKYKFIEIDPTLLNVLQEGEKLKFCGLKDENAVLCTRNKTYEVKEAETSNSLLLLSSLKWSDEVDEADTRTLEEREVCGIFHKYFELRPCLPQLHKLRSLLKEHPYSGPEHEDEDVNQTTGYSFEGLLARVQASEEELQLALSEETACCINGRWRMLDPKYQLRVLSLILGVVEENSWTFDAVVKDEVCQALSEIVPAEILIQCFSWYTEPVGETDSNGAALYRIIEAKVCRFMGEMILATVEGLTLENFITAWQNSIPEGMKLQTSYMDGLMLVKKVNDKEIVQYFPESDLPINISERFSVLFEIREKWTYDEIYPFIARFASGNMNVGALLTKFARSSKSNGIKCYTSKHGR